MYSSFKETQLFTLFALNELLILSHQGRKTYIELKAELGDATDIIKITVVSGRHTVCTTLATTGHTLTFQKNPRYPHCRCVCLQDMAKGTTQSSIGMGILGPSTVATFPVDKLVHQQPDDLPEGVDPTRKEVRQTHEE